MKNVFIFLGKLIDFMFYLFAIVFGIIIVLNPFVPNLKVSLFQLVAIAAGILMIMYGFDKLKMMENKNKKSEGDIDDHNS